MQARQAARAILNAICTATLRNAPSLELQTWRRPRHCARNSAPFSGTLIHDGDDGDHDEDGDHDDYDDYADDDGDDDPSTSAPQRIPVY